MGHTPFELNYGYHLQILYEEKVDSCSQSKLADKLLVELRELMNVCREKLYYAQELQKQALNKGVESWSYVLGKKVWLNSKYIGTKRNQILVAKFFRPF